MKVKVICKKCDIEFEWEWGQQNKLLCPNCGKIQLKDTKLAAGEIVKLFK